MTTSRQGALAGWLFLLTHVTSIGAVMLYGGVSRDPFAAADRIPVLSGAVLEIVLAAAVLGTSVALYPILRVYRVGLAEAYVALRTLEAGIIVVGVVALLPTVGQPGSTSVTDLGPTTAAGLRLVHEWAFLVGPGIVCPINTVVLAWALLSRALVPRTIAVLGLVGGPLIGCVNLAVMFGLLDATPPPAVVPIFAWEISLALYLIVRGIPASREPAGTAVGPGGHRPDTDLRVQDRRTLR